MRKRLEQGFGRLVGNVNHKVGCISTILKHNSKSALFSIAYNGYLQVNTVILRVMKEILYMHCYSFECGSDLA